MTKMTPLVCLLLALFSVVLATAQPSMKERNSCNGRSYASSCCCTPQRTVTRFVTSTITSAVATITSTKYITIRLTSSKTTAKTYSKSSVKTTKTTTRSTTKKTSPGTLTQPASSTTGAVISSGGATLTSVSGATSSGVTAKTVSASSVTGTTSIPVSRSIYGTIQNIVNGSNPKSYSLSGFKTILDQFSDLRGIANGDDASYTHVTVFAWTNAAISAWTAAGGPGKDRRDLKKRLTELREKHGKRGAGMVAVSGNEQRDRFDKHIISEIEEEIEEMHQLEEMEKRDLEPRQALDLGANAKEFLSYSFLPLTVNPTTLPPKALAKTLLEAPGKLVQVETQFMVITKNAGVIYPFFGASNSTVIDTISCTNGVLFVVSTVLNPPVNPSTTIASIADLASFNSTFTALKLYAQLDAFGVPDSGNGITILGIIDEYWTTQDFSNLWAGLTAMQKVNLLNYNILNGVYYSYQLTNGLILDTLLRENTVVVSRTTSSGATTIAVNDNNLVILDLLTRNGVVRIFEVADILKFGYLSESEADILG
jgi:hypothetical protein